MEQGAGQRPDNVCVEDTKYIVKCSPDSADDSSAQNEAVPLPDP